MAHPTNTLRRPETSVDFLGNTLRAGDTVYYVTPRQWAHAPVYLAVGTVKHCTPSGVLLIGHKTARPCRLIVKALAQ